MYVGDDGGRCNSSVVLNPHAPSRRPAGSPGYIFQPMRMSCWVPGRGVRPWRRSSPGATPPSLWARNPEVADEINEEHTNAVPAGLPLPPRWGHGRPRKGGRAGRAADRRACRRTGSARRSRRPSRHPAVGPGGQPDQGPRAGSLLRMTEVIKDVLPGHPAAALIGAEHRQGDHGRAGRRERDRHRGPLRGRGAAAGAAARAVPGLHEPRRHRLRGRRRAEERRRHRLPASPRASASATTRGPRSSRVAWPS